MSRLGALVLTGGASARMGTDKAALLWSGVRAVDRLAELASRLGADPVLTAGGRSYGLPAVVDEAPGGGPVSGVTAGCRALAAAGCERALVLAVDAATITPEDLAPLLAAPTPGAAYADLHLPLLLHLGALPADAGPGWSMGRLIAAAGLSLVEPAPEGRLRLRGANTPDERAALLAELGDREAARNRFDTPNRVYSTKGSTS
jgi:molybdopterin-guanine dinucleotide biosynthesis protein A